MQKSGHANEDLLFSPIDEYMKELQTHFPNSPTSDGKVRDAAQLVSSEDSSDSRTNSQNSRKSVPELTGAAHILMERDLLEDKYDLMQNGKRIVLKDEHF